MLDMADPAALRLLRGALAVDQTTDGYCMCAGELAFEFFDGSGWRIAVVGFHHGASLRWQGWDGDVRLRDGGRVLHWLADHGVVDPLARAAKRQRARQEAQLAQERWKTAAPAAVRDLVDLAVAASGSSGVLPRSVCSLVGRRLAEAIPDRVERAAALLIWYGSGTGRCSGYPVHEALPASALSDTPIGDLVEALQLFPTDARIVAGAVRHLCSWKSRTHQARDITRLSPELRARLLAVACESGDDDKHRRAERWLGVYAG
ncbi:MULTISPECIES: hypothetical protein [Pseudofrankia]|uniref:hypothetical protein n=1 Tax=Pseudofrankia TaxID=2994363 RepID=UPI0010427FE8|nr:MULTISPECIES: hypothetical protein [Pseudofrankia]